MVTTGLELRAWSLRVRWRQRHVKQAVDEARDVGRIRPITLPSVVALEGAQDPTRALLLSSFGGCGGLCLRNERNGQKFLGSCLTSQSSDTKHHRKYEGLMIDCGYEPSFESVSASALDQLPTEFSLCDAINDKESFILASPCTNRNGPHIHQDLQWSVERDQKRPQNDMKSKLL